MNATDTPLKVKGYFDGSFKEDVKIGIGGWYFIITEGNKTLIFSNCTYETAEDSVISEFIGLIGLLNDINKYIKDLSVKSICIYGDCETVIDRLKNKIEYKQKYIPYIIKAKELIKIISKPIVFVKIQRKKNKKANKLCRLVLKDIDNIVRMNEHYKKQCDSVQPIQSSKPKKITPLVKLKQVNKTNLQFRPTPRYDRIIRLLNQVSG